MSLQPSDQQSSQRHHFLLQVHSPTTSPRAFSESHFFLISYHIICSIIIYFILPPPSDFMELCLCVCQSRHENYSDYLPCSHNGNIVMLIVLSIDKTSRLQLKCLKQLNRNKGQKSEPSLVLCCWCCTDKLSIFSIIIIVVAGVVVIIIRNIMMMILFSFAWTDETCCVLQTTPGPGSYEPHWNLGDPLSSETEDTSFSLLFRDAV